ncbi:MULTISPECIES: pyrroloquinoline quinone biosynthesis protein PqqF [Pseudomonas]|nr:MULTISPECIES: pyrroloquinoline quinone biosynthesis protein PqqF [Pseudomonas]
MSVMSEVIPAAVQPWRLRQADGARLCLLSQAGPYAALCVRVAAGSHDEPRAYPGLAHFLEHLLFLGGQRFAGEQRLMPFVQACGGQLNASTQARFTDYFFEVPVEHFAAALERLADMLATPLLDIDAQRREREVLHAEFIARSQDLDTLIDTALGQLLAGDHPAAAFLAGNRDTLPVEQARFQQALRGFYRRHYRRSQLTLTLVGPQPLAHLQQLAEGLLAALPGGRVRPPRAVAAMVPLRGQYLRMQVASGAPQQLFAWALTWPEALLPAACEQALEALRLALADPSPGGLLACLREVGLAQRLQLQVVYRYRQQTLLRLVVDLVQDSSAKRAQVRGVVHSWLSFFAGADWAPLLARVQQRQQYAELAGGALQRARQWQTWQALNLHPAAPLEAQAAEALQLLCAQVQSESRLIEGEIGSEPVAAWPTGGFPLQMVLQTPGPRLMFEHAWQLPGDNPLMAVTVALPALARPVALHWQPAPSADGLAVLYARRQDLDAPGRAAARDLLHSLQDACAEVGVQLRVSDEEGAQTLCLRGPAEPLGQLAVHVWARWLQVPQSIVGPAAVASAALPIRQLLARLDELIVPAPGRTHRIEGLGVGLTQQHQARLQALFGPPDDMPEPPAQVPRQALWREAHLPPGEHALVLFCPQPEPTATSEAAWRLLAQRLQPGYYQRMRSDLQLGYAVFCAYRQVAGVRGLLFAVQSPEVPPLQLIAHIETFMREATAVPLDALALAAQSSALQAQRRAQVQTLDGFAEQHWLDLLAGLQPSHADAVDQALLALTPDNLLAAQQALRTGPWRVLASAPGPVHWRQSS